MDRTIDHDLENVLQGLIAWVGANVPGTSGFLVPVSGGSDSALCLWLCAHACSCPGRVHAVHFGDDLRCSDWFSSVGDVQMLPPALAEGARWGSLIAMRERRWLVGSRNATEDALGTYSVDSTCATFLPIVGLPKCRVMALARYVGVPEGIVASSRLADPACGRPQEMADIPLEVVDAWLRALKEHPALLASSDGLGLIDIHPDHHALLRDTLRRNTFKRHLPLRGRHW